MTRPRYPHPYAIYQLVIRSLSFLFELACLSYFIYASTAYHISNAIFYLGLTWCLLLDLYETIALLNTKRTIKRWSSNAVIGNDIGIALSLGLIGCLYQFLGGLGYGGLSPPPKPPGYEDTFTRCCTLVVAVSGIHLALMMAYCIGGCARREDMREQQS